jgi:hypothetical protein
MRGRPTMPAADPTPLAQRLRDIEDAIDQLVVHHCGHCDTPLGPEAPSKYWCGDVCQAAWNQARSEALVGYREPVELSQHVCYQFEEGSPEATPTRPWHLPDLVCEVTGLVDVFNRVGEAAYSFDEGWSDAYEQIASDVEALADSIEKGEVDV